MFGRISCHTLTLVRATTLCAVALAYPAQAQGQAKEAAPAATDPASPTGEVFVDLTDVLGKPVAGRVDFEAAGQKKHTINVPGGQERARINIGTYDAYVYALAEGVPYLVDLQPLAVEADRTTYVAISLVEGATDLTPLSDFDRDFDLALDRVELKAQTQPDDPADTPGQRRIAYASTVLSPEGGWYRGDLHTHSDHGGGALSVKQLIREAERLKLDFLAIADRNTLASIEDKDYASEKLVLIPAMEWGNDQQGVGLVYGPRTMPPAVETQAHAQAVCKLVQAQGGIFAVAHPCFRTAPWQWGLSYVNAVEVWCRGWQEVPGMDLAALDPFWRERRDGKLIHSIALAVAPSEFSANEQAIRFYDYEVLRGLRAAPIGGSNYFGKSGKLAEPVTYVYAREKSLDGILEGLRLGRTYVSSGVAGPKISLKAKFGKILVGEGGQLPVGVDFELYVFVEGAKGKRIQLYENGRPIRSTTLKGDEQGFKIERNVPGYSVYRATLSEPNAGAAKDPRFGLSSVLAVSGTIYLENILPIDLEKTPEDYWFRLEPDQYVDSDEWMADIERQGSQTLDAQELR